MSVSAPLKATECRLTTVVLQGYLAGARSYFLYLFVRGGNSSIAFEWNETEELNRARHEAVGILNQFSCVTWACSSVG